MPHRTSRISALAPPPHSNRRKQREENSWHRYLLYAPLASQSHLSPNLTRRVYRPRDLIAIVAIASTTSNITSGA